VAQVIECLLSSNSITAKNNNKTDLRLIPAYKIDSNCVLVAQACNLSYWGSID
jgi:hypothetical protein